MDITEEVIRRRETLPAKGDSVYPEIRDLIERRMDFDHVSEEKYYHDTENGTVRSELKAEQGFDEHTEAEYDIFIVVSASGEVDIQVKGKLVTEYEFSGNREPIWHYAYRALYEKFIYGTVRQGYVPAVEEKTDELLTRLRQNMEVS